MKKCALAMSFVVAAFASNASAASWIATSVEDWSFDSATVADPTFWRLVGGINRH